MFANGPGHGRCNGGKGGGVVISLDPGCCWVVAATASHSLQRFYSRVQKMSGSPVVGERSWGHIKKKKNLL